MKYQVTVSLITLVAGCLGHMYPSTPCVRGSPLAQCGYPNPNVNLMAPIGTDNKPTFPICHHAEPYASPVETVQAGSSITVSFDGTAIHNGGHCEFSLSYDGGKTFVAIQTIIKKCFLEGKSFSVPIPKEAPNGKAVFAWSWVNATGNREFYMTCSDIEIQGGGSGSLKGPKMLTPNYDGSSPKIGEFGQGGDDCSNLYKERPTIEISAGGAAASSGGQSKYPEAPASGGTNGQSPTEAGTPTATPTAGAASPTVQPNPTGSPSNPATTPTAGDSAAAPQSTPTGSSAYPATTPTTGDSSAAPQPIPANTATGNTTASAAQPDPASTTTDNNASIPVKNNEYPSAPALPTQPTGGDTTPGSVPGPGSASNGLATCVAIGKSPEYQTMVNGQTIKSTCGATLVCKQTSVGGVYCDFS
ncbi:hypothetical protein IWQ62_006161 [Dispira parvispora]|uniref:Chitin-binding type-4 domain-containing protein n=1 Tax=Dispira parvispora TaxID=1520584 RepID=A0A9W8AKV2_9FUNG|nr:hypothetical protein IWQ62_006161 [Dispira parvispora]